MAIGHFFAELRADDRSWSKQQQQDSAPRRLRRVLFDERVREKRGFSFRCSYEIGRFNYSAYHRPAAGMPDARF